MKQLIQNLRTGEFDFDDIPPPALKAGGVIVRTTRCLLHAGAALPSGAISESQLPAPASIALAAPAPRRGLMRRMWTSLRAEGVKSAYRTFATRNASIKAMEYVGVGVVLEAAPGVKLRPGARVAWAGCGMFPPSEIAFAPVRACVAIPDAVGDDAAVYALPGGVALRAVRQARAELGSWVGVFGETVIAQLAARLVRASGCRTLTAEASVSDETSLHAVVAASDAPDERWIDRAVRLAAPGARVVVCGDGLSREALAKLRAREANVVLAWSGGGGVGEPLGDEGTSYAAPSPTDAMRDFLSMLEAELLSIDGLTTHRFELDRAKAAVDILFQKKDSAGGVVISYPTASDGERRQTRFDVSPGRRAIDGGVGVSFVGTESRLGQTVLAALAARAGSTLTGVANATGESAKSAAAEHAFAYCTTEFRDLLADGRTDAVFVGAPARARAMMATECLKSRKAVYVAAPPCVTETELRELGAAARASDALLMVGFARRFSPIAREFQRRIAGDGPVCLTYRICGTAESFGWPDGASLFDLECMLGLSEFFDFAQFLADSEPTRVMAQAIHRAPGAAPFESLSVSIAFANGGVGQVVAALVEDEKSVGERIECVSAQTSGFLENFVAGEVTRNGATDRIRIGGADFGHRASMEAFFTGLAKPDESPLPFRTASAALTTAFRVREALETGQPVRIVF
jgi:predicted dehydrogenase